MGIQRQSRYKVVVNHEEQFDILPVEKTADGRWREVGKQGTAQECLDYIEEVWTDMRPLSLQKIKERLNLP